MTNDELKPCPFCGEEASIVKMNVSNTTCPVFLYGCACENCGACLPRNNRTKEKAIELWNRRPQE